ncbi:DUF3592 domain-containing protein [Pseudarthrobacter sp. J75]|uniref:DUF3592 domain-containing protein n=1 Tax=unclassified Pseudarthrobacter TaxID=2647000 RepID=UPI002E81AE75|nr:MULTISPECIES: DUF3592 domain-containing protein [unclassified Pseudarthrobacter]MEE2521983.1 DUF3592 domain-containing protein [Pseudarthrobacter sp. J47]MEE2528908.1 DUF3592 domain-containing protein [Pseudarthrobacter sp. J75]
MRTVMYIAWAIFVVAAVISIIHTVRKTRRHERETADWPRVPATVTGHTAGWSGGTGGSTRNRRYFPAYRFMDSRGTLYMGQSEIPVVEVPVPGNVIEVAYNPADPNHSFQPSPKTRQTLGCVIPFMVALAVAFYFFIGLFPE